MRNDLRTYIYKSTSLRLALHDGETELPTALLREVADAQENLTTGELLEADLRVDHAMKEILNCAAPPRPKNLERDGRIAVDVDLIGEELVTRTKRLRRTEREPWRETLVDVMREHDKRVTAQRHAVLARRVPDDNSVLKGEMEALKSEVATIRQTSLMGYLGTWEPGAYALGVTVTYGGSLWRANKRSATDKPGTSDQWTLVVKRGRDARDTRSRNEGVAQ